ncbi:MAG: ATP-dependent DNA helicase RecG [Oscillospiraceae bacterium]|nr:ATP-dependent DNA helicase RecG [Oscillospiraceae bacterium]
MSYLTSDIKKLKGIGEKRAELYAKLGINSPSALLSHYPRGYIDYTNPTPILDTISGEYAVVRATVYKKTPEQRVRKGLSIFKVFASDGESELLITIFNNRFAYEGLKIDNEYIFYGKITSGNLIRKEMNSPLYIPASQACSMSPIYPLTTGLTSKMIETNVKQALELCKDEFVDNLPAYIKNRYNLCDYDFALSQIHFPTSYDNLEKAKKRLIFEELLSLSLSMAMLKGRSKQKSTLKINDVATDEITSLFPFSLTGAQIRAICEAKADMLSPYPMNRLLQGDVGSGKTAVSAGVSYIAIKSGYQVALMAPTEILATQHYNNLKPIFEKLGISTALLTGSTKAQQKREILQNISDGSAQFIIGTHALLSDSVEFRNLGLVITDEQHRFGVKQRSALAEKGKGVHLLVMSATPIPRTLALIIYGDLDISILDELPPGRQKVDTLLIDGTIRQRALGFIKKHCDEGRQAYIVCPLIDDSESELVSATSYVEKMCKTSLAGCKTAILHSKMKTAEKDAIMQSFKENKTQVLISTTVIEVGIDVPNAVIMMIENAERFGLSQLHQLRGRVGRGSDKSYCILVSDASGEISKKRLGVMVETSDGFKIAEEDLKLRGPGDFFGGKQHGLPQFKIADMTSDTSLLKLANDCAKEILEADENLSHPQNAGLLHLINEMFNKISPSGLN